METFETDIEFDADTGPIRATGIFAIRSTTSDAEPFSWGGSRGTERETDATLMQVNLGGLTLARELASQIVTPGEWAQIEAAAADQWEVEQGLADIPWTAPVADPPRPQPALTFTQWARRKLSNIRRRAIFAAE